MAKATKEAKETSTPETETIRVRALRKYYGADLAFHDPDNDSRDFLLFPREYVDRNPKSPTYEQTVVLTAQEQFSEKHMERLGPGKPRQPQRAEKVKTVAKSMEAMVPGDDDSNGADEI